MAEPLLQGLEATDRGSCCCYCCEVAAAIFFDDGRYADGCDDELDVADGAAAIARLNVLQSATTKTIRCRYGTYIGQSREGGV